MAEILASAADTPAADITRTAITMRTNEPPPSETIGALRWLRRNLFNSPFNSVLTLLTMGLIAYWGAEFIRWGILDAVWYTPDHNVCRRATGACWAVVAEKHRPMLFGVYPYEQHWRLDRRARRLHIDRHDVADAAFSGSARFCSRSGSERLPPSGSCCGAASSASPSWMPRNGAACR